MNHRLADQVPLSSAASSDVPWAPPAWPGNDTSRIPFWAYTREDVYQRELERLFYKGHWCYVGLAAEIPNHGDFKTPGAEDFCLSAAALYICSANL